MLHNSNPQDSVDRKGFYKLTVPITNDLLELRAAARECHGCPLYLRATQTVFGEGERSAEMVLVGEQPGDKEDVAGKPFVGPAGLLLDRALAAIHIDRRRCYVTNAVKHFKWRAAGKRRIHQKPGAREIEACRPWLEAEIRGTDPRVLICMGATAVRSIFRRELPIQKSRDRWMSSSFCPKTLITVHPSSVLRVTDRAQRNKEYEEFVADLAMAAEYLNGRFPHPFV
jgi:uracil-DNA glycosylase